MAGSKSASLKIAVSKQAVDAACKTLSNWGKRGNWGRDDQIGTLNNGPAAE